MSEQNKELTPSPFKVQLDEIQSICSLLKRYNGRKDDINEFTKNSKRLTHYLLNLLKLKDENFTLFENFLYIERFFYVFCYIAIIMTFHLVFSF